MNDKVLVLRSLESIPYDYYAIVDWYYEDEKEIELATRLMLEEMSVAEMLEEMEKASVIC